MRSCSLWLLSKCVARHPSESHNTLTHHALLQNGNKVVCGTQEGVLDIFNWGEWGDLSDRFVGHPQSVDAVVALTEDIICTGSSDGLIRCVWLRSKMGRGMDGKPIRTHLMTDP